MFEILRQILRMAVLCGSLGFLLYLALMTLVESPTAVPYVAPVIGLIGAASIGILTFQSLVFAWRTGKFPTRLRAIDQDDEPGWFWGSMLWSVLMVICFIALASWSLSQLFDLLGAPPP